MEVLCKSTIELTSENKHLSDMKPIMTNRRVEEIFLNVTHDVKPNVKSKGWPERRRCLVLNVKLLFSFGFLRAEGRERRGPLFYWRYIYPRVQLIRMTYSIIFQAVNVSLVWGNASLMAEYFVVFGMYAMALSKCITIFFYQDTIHAMTTTLDRMFSWKMTPNKELRKSMARTNRFAHYITKYGLISLTSFVILIGIGIFVLGICSRTLPFRRWFPYDAYSFPAFEVTLFITSVLAPIDFTIVFICDTLFIALNMHIVEQFQVLAYKLRHARAIVETTRKNKEHVALLSECLGESLGLPTVMAAAVTRDSQRSGGPRLDARGRCRVTVRSNRSIDDDREVTTLGEFVDNGGESGRETRNEEVETISELTTKRTEIETNSRMESYFKECIKNHQELLRLCEQLNRAFKVMLSFQVLCNIACGVVVLYATTLARSVDLKVVSFLAAALACYLEYFLFCWYGNRITEESVNVRDAIYDCDWFGASESFKRSMRIVILRTNKPIIIRAGGLPLSMRTFKKIYKASYYLNMILSKLFHGEKMIK